MEELKQPYKGRGIILGQLEDARPFGAYFVTGRSESSRARILEQDDHEGIRVFTRPTDESKLRGGDVDL